MRRPLLGGALSLRGLLLALQVPRVFRVPLHLVDDGLLLFATFVQPVARLPRHLVPVALHGGVWTSTFLEDSSVDEDLCGSTVDFVSLHDKDGPILRIVIELDACPCHLLHFVRKGLGGGTDTPLVGNNDGRLGLGSRLLLDVGLLLDLDVEKLPPPFALAEFEAQDIARVCAPIEHAQVEVRQECGLLLPVDDELHPDSAEVFLLVEIRLDHLSFEAFRRRILQFDGFGRRGGCAFGLRHFRRRVHFRSFSRCLDREFLLGLRLFLFRPDAGHLLCLSQYDVYSHDGVLCLAV